MTDDIGVRVSVGSNKAKSLVFRNGPADHRRWRVRILKARVVAFIPLAAGYNSLNKAVSRDGGGEGAQQGCGLKE